ncbi:MAG TPA: glycosyltransferase [Candidatus Baltobacteraceae bacterium]|nr:glycosyltransferase [Candidatus Baltobacteraceae bacterium]
MIVIAILVAFLVLVNLAFAFRSQYIAFNSRFALESVPAPKVAPKISIIVPARNEAHQIEQCVRSLLAQDYPDLDVIVLDDCSEDRTAAIVARVAAEDPRLRLIHGEPLPEGWVGKPWALDQGARRADGDWLLFTDADTTHEPGALSAAFGYARAGNLDVLSVLTEQVMQTPAERIFLPSILWTIAFAIGSLKAINDPARESALFNGQYVLASRRAYAAIGGHEAVRGEIAEDLELARRFKRDGRFRTALVNGNGLVRVRMYCSFRELWQGFVKNFWVGARDQHVLAAIGVFLLACVSPLTPIVLIAALVLHASAFAVALAIAMCSAIAGAAPGMRRLGLGASSPLYLPIGISAVAAIFLTSIVRHACGGVSWRGRRYA